MDTVKGKARQLVSEMTTEEKIHQMLHAAPAIPRLGIPKYNWWNEALHGVARAGVATVFPQAIGMAASFNKELIGKIADIISTEGRAKHHEYARRGDFGMYKGLTFWSPNINIFRDPRWGRGHETYGEDPYLTTELALAFIKGIQGGDENHLKAAACAKHFAVHSGPEATRFDFDSVVSKKDMYETYLPAFEACVKEGKVEAIMGAYNAINGEPCCCNDWLLNELLRKKWGFEGHVVSDCGAIHNLHAFHKITTSHPESVARSVKNGCDLNCGQAYLFLHQALEEGLIEEHELDASVERLMCARIKLGILEEESSPYSGIPYTENDKAEHSAVNLIMARESIVLLKNDKKLLPINAEKIQKIAVIGPNADSREVLKGNYCGTSSDYVTVLQGLKDLLGKERVAYAPGCGLLQMSLETLEPEEIPLGDRLTEAAVAAEMSDIVVLCLGLDPSVEGENGDAFNAEAGGDKKDLELPECQRKLLKTISALGKPMVVLLFSGSALSVDTETPNLDAVVQCFYSGATGGTAIAEMLFGKYSPSGRLPVTFYRSVDQLPPFEEYSMENRTYKYFTGEPLFPFGYGLSYTNFTYGEIKLDKAEYKTGESVGCTVTLKNTGEYDGYEVTESYIASDITEFRLPQYELKGFEKVFLARGEEKEIHFTFTPEALSVINMEGDRLVMPANYTLYIGSGQPDEKTEELSGTTVKSTQFTLSGETLVLDTAI